VSLNNFSPHRTLSKKERKNLERLRKVSSESSENKDPHAKKYRDKMCHAFSHLHDKKSDESIKAFTEIIKDKSVCNQKKEQMVHLQLLSICFPG